jgi:hypothetical protein
VTRRVRGHGPAMLAVLVALLAALGAGASSDHVSQQASSQATAAVVGLISVSHANSEEPTQLQPAPHRASHQAPASATPTTLVNLRARLRADHRTIAQPTPAAVRNPLRTRGPPVTF